MSHARYRPPDPSKGDESTIGGYTAVHDRPAAFEGSDGFSYSVEMMVESTGDPSGTWGAFFLFVKWARLGAQSPEGHLETEFLLTAASEEDAAEAIGETPLTEVKLLLDRLIAQREGSAPTRQWWDAMRDENDANDEHRE
ncbi:MAG TPA: hypothetical protein VGM82_22395 [Gemmatimonadaceae bacterium]|jgi:hypothetical protein